jgi:hypothetical protein
MAHWYCNLLIASLPVWLVVELQSMYQGPKGMCLRPAAWFDLAQVGSKAVDCSASTIIVPADTDVERNDDLPAVPR